MSSYIVSERTINAIATFVYYGKESESNAGNNSKNYTKSVMEKYGYNIWIEEGADKLVNDLYEMNLKAVDYRYSETNPREKISFKVEIQPLMQVLKCMRCLRYEASEGNIPKTKAYRFLDELINKTQAWYIDNLPEYDKAEWGLEDKQEAQAITN